MRVSVDGPSVSNGRSAIDAVEVRRSGLVESRHVVHVAVVDRTGALVAAAGDPDRITFLRSATKPFQALPFADLAIGQDWPQEYVAMACASHGGTGDHVAVVRSLALASGVDLGWLKCGVHDPLDWRAATALRFRGEAPQAVHNNCSGKHTAMLAVCVSQGWPTDTYLEPDHPLQRWILAEVSDALGEPPVHVGVDGCSAPTFAAPLRRAASAFLGLARTGSALGSVIAPAMRSHPVLLSGAGRLDAVAMSEVDGLVAKEGAEGVWLATVLAPAHGPVGIALKVEDGGERARAVAALHVLEKIGVTDLSSDGLAALARPTLRNAAGIAVGEIVASFALSGFDRPRAHKPRY